MRASVMSAKAAKDLLTDVSVVGKKIVVVGNRGHILFSTDDGHTWTQGHVPVSVLLTGVFMVSEQEGWAIGHDAVILHTSDGGEHWELQYANPYQQLSKAQLDKLTDEQYNELPRQGSPLLDLWFKNSKEGFVVGAYGVLLHTDNGGKTWDDWSSRLNNQDNWHLNAIGSADGKTIYIAGEKGNLFRSLDSGATWSKLKSPYDGSFFGIMVGPDPASAMVFGLQGHIYRTHDQGETWQQINNPSDNGLMAGVNLNDHVIILVGNSGTILTSKDDGNTFSLQTTHDRQAIVGIGKTDNGKLVMVGQGGVKLAAPSAM